MRKILLKSILLVTVAVVAVSAADLTLGTWKLNMDKSKFTPSAPVKSLTTTREASDDGVKVTTTGERADGTAVNASYTAKYDGKECPVTGAPYDAIAIKQVSPHVLTTTRKNSGNKYAVTSRLLVSKDGKTLTDTIKGTDGDGKAINYSMVWEKQ